MSGRERQGAAPKAVPASAAKPRDAASLIMADPFSGRILLAGGAGGLRLPVETLQPGDGACEAQPGPAISRTRLGAQEDRAHAFMDAALRAAFSQLGLLIARPCPPETGLPGLWGRMRRHGLAPDRTRLTYLGRSISPTDEADRRHVRVFAAPLAAATNSLIRGAPEEAAWLSPDEAAMRLKDPAASVFAGRALRMLGSRARPVLVSFRAGQARIAAL